MIRATLGSIPTVISSPSLAFEKFHVYDQDNHGKWVAGNGRASSYAAIARAAHLVSGPDYQTWHGRFDEASRDAGADCVLRAPTSWRLVIGWASNPGLETGLTLHRLLGFPYLPGSAVKGLVHRIAEMELTDDPAAFPDLTTADLQTFPSPSLDAAIASAEFVRAVFGSLHVVRPHADLPQTAFERLTVWKDLLLANKDSLTDDWKSVPSRLQTLCASENLGGVATFFDAVPVPHSLALEPALQVDVLTPHHSAYYSGGPFPDDMEGPNPIRFLSVRPGLEFEFRVRIRMPGPSTDAAGAQQTTALAGVDEQTIRTRVTKWLRRGLEESGLGAKTAAGYGYFTIRTEAEEADAVAQQLLPDGMADGNLGTAIDRADRLPDAQRAAVARRVVTGFPDCLARWRNQQREASVRRVAWVDEWSGR